MSRSLPSILPPQRVDALMPENNTDDKFRLQLRFWGVRGSIPATGARFSEFGGNTACLEIRLPTGEVIVFDCGSGLRHLGKLLAQEKPQGGRDIPIFLTHFHWDHIQGIPFFQPLFDPRNRATVYSMREDAPQRLSVAISRPYFPLDFDQLGAPKQLVQAGSDPVECFGATVQPFPMNHPQGAIGYRIEHQGASIVYASDLEHGDAHLDQVLVDSARGADVLIYDAQYTPEEYETKRGWGHSTWREAARVAREAGVKRLVLIHHDPEHEDAEIHRIVDQARAEFECTEGAKEGLTIRL